MISERFFPTKATWTWSVARDLRATGYPYMVMPDHVPSHPADPHGLQAFAYAYGYIKGVLQAI